MFGRKISGQTVMSRVHLSAAIFVEPRTGRIKRFCQALLLATASFVQTTAIFVKHTEQSLIVKKRGWWPPVPYIFLGGQWSKGLIIMKLNLEQTFTLKILIFMHINIYFYFIILGNPGHRTWQNKDSCLNENTNFICQKKLMI